LTFLGRAYELKSIADYSVGPSARPIIADDAARAIDEAVFRQVTVDEFGVVCWPNGPDLALDAIPCFCGQIESVASVGRKSPEPGQVSRPR
jgi:hypothetical protein